MKGECKSVAFQAHYCALALVWDIVIFVVVILILFPPQ